MEYYIKRCGAQELGSVRNGRAQRGRYLYTPVHPLVQPFFPKLSKKILNDFCPLALIPLHLNPARKVYCNYVYHNDLHHGSTASTPHNECRIYLNQSVEGGRLVFQKEDIMIFRNVNPASPESGLYLYRVHDKNSELYCKCARILSVSEIGRNYATYSGLLSEVESCISAVEGGKMTVIVDEGLRTKIDSTEKLSFSIPSDWN